jgi:hypothetical protein
LQDSHKRKTAVLLGASPAIKKQIDKLRNLQYDPRYVFIGISSGLEFLLSNGIKPRYVMIADADPSISRFWQNLNEEDTRGITLISSISASPEMFEKWKGDIKFLAIETTIPKLDKKFKRWYNPINGLGCYFFALSSQYNTGAAFAFTVLNCPILIFVGNELSFETESTPYYVDREDLKDKWLKKPHPNIYGEKVYTNYMFMSLKLALEDFLGKCSGNGWFFNATEAGIFGVSNRFGNLPWIYQLRLDMAIAQANSLMATGKSIVLTS